MNIDCVFTHEYFNAEIAETSTVIAIDILRATSTIATALANGAKEILPQKEIADAISLAKTLPTAILSGERNGDTLEGFDLGNSPLEFTRERINDKSIVCCTTNGTTAITAAIAAPLVLCGSLLNASVTAQAALAAGNDLILLCSGTNGRVSYDDLIGAGCIIHKIYLQKQQLGLTDAAKLAFQAYMINKQDLLNGLLSSAHGDKLYRCDRREDVAYCAQEDLLATICVYQNGKIISL